MKIRTLLSALFLLSVFYSFAQKDKYSFKETYDVSSPAKLTVSTSDGDIEVIPADGPQINVFYLVTKAGNFIEISRAELEEHLNIDITHDGGNLEIAVRNKNNSGWSNWRDQYEVSFEIYAPTNTSCYLKSSDGDIKLKGFSGNQKCKTSDGDICMTDIVGGTDAITSDGDVIIKNITGATFVQTSDGDLKVENVEGDAEFITSDGDIRMVRVMGVISAETSDGDITFLDCAGSFSGSTSDGEIRGNMTKINGKLSLVTSDGNIDVGVPAGIGMDLDLKAEDLDLPRMDMTGEFGDHFVNARVNGGGVVVKLRTSDGRVTLSYN